MLHVLLAEDNPGDVLLIREAIRTSDLNADVMIAYDGEEALEMLHDDSVNADVVLLDLQMPKLSGLQVLERYRADDGPPVVVFTSSPNPNDQRKAFELGVKDYVVKPLDLDAFMQSVREALGRWISYGEYGSN
jgi:two-component system response regulator